MRIIWILPLLCCAFLTACSSISLDVNKGRINAETFTWMSYGDKTEKPVHRQEIDVSLQNAIESFMTENGIKKVQSGGDITIGYMILLRDSASTSASTRYFGLGLEAKKIQNLAHERAGKLYEEIEEDRTRDHRKVRMAAIVIDITDTGSSKLLYRNSAYRELMKEPTGNQRETRIKEAVREALKGAKL